MEWPGHGEVPTAAPLPAAREKTGARAILAASACDRWLEMEVREWRGCGRKRVRDCGETGVNFTGEPEARQRREKDKLGVILGDKRGRGGFERVSTSCSDTVKQAAAYRQGRTQCSGTVAVDEAGRQLRGSPAVAELVLVTVLWPGKPD